MLLHGCARRPGGEPTGAARHRHRPTPPPTAASPSASPVAVGVGPPPFRRSDRVRHRAGHHQRFAGPAARRRTRTGALIELTVLVVANLLATAARFVLLRGWVFHPRRNRELAPKPKEPFDPTITADTRHARSAPRNPAATGRQAALGCALRCSRCCSPPRCCTCGGSAHRAGPTTSTPPRRRRARRISKAWLFGSLGPRQRRSRSTSRPPRCG